MVDGEPTEEDEELRIRDTESATGTSTQVFKNPEFVKLTAERTRTSTISSRNSRRRRTPKSKNRKYLVAAYWLRNTRTT